MGGQGREQSEAGAGSMNQEPELMYNPTLKQYALRTAENRMVVASLITGKVRSISEDLRVYEEAHERLISLSKQFADAAWKLEEIISHLEQS